MRLLCILASVIVLMLGPSWLPRAAATSTFGFGCINNQYCAVCGFGTNDNGDTWCFDTCGHTLGNEPATQIPGILQAQRVKNMRSTGNHL